MVLKILLTGNSFSGLVRDADSMGVVFKPPSDVTGRPDEVHLIISKADPGTPPGVLEKLILVLQEFQQELTRGESTN
jgi:hypothetical protein